MYLIAHCLLIYPAIPSQCIVLRSCVCTASRPHHVPGVLCVHLLTLAMALGMYLVTLVPAQFLMLSHCAEPLVYNQCIQLHVQSL